MSFHICFGGLYRFLAEAPTAHQARMRALLPPLLSQLGVPALQFLLPALGQLSEVGGTEGMDAADHKAWLHALLQPQVSCTHLHMQV